MIAALLSAAALQMDPSAFASACLAGGGAPGQVTASSDRDVGRNTVVAEGALPVTVTVTVNQISSGQWIYVEIDGRTGPRVPAGGSVIVTGRRLALAANERQGFDYCLRLQSR